MGILDIFRSSGAAEPINAVGNVVEKTGNALDNLFTSDDERLTHAELMERIRQRPSEWAHQLNLLNAQDRNWFNSGWRPALGWVGALSLFVYFVPQYCVATYLWAVQILDHGQYVKYPASDDGLWELITLLIAGKTLRTVEKSEGVSK